MAFVDFILITLDIPVEYRDHVSARNFRAPRLYIGDPTVAPPVIGPEGVVVQRAGDIYGSSLTGDVALYYAPADEPICARPRTKNAAGGFLIKCPPFSTGGDGTAVFHVPAWLLDRTSVAGTPVEEDQICDGGASANVIVADVAISEFGASGSVAITNPESRFTPDPVITAAPAAPPTVAAPARKGWGVFRAGATGTDATAWSTYRSKPDPIDSHKIKSALIYDLNTQIVQDIAAQTRPIVRRSASTPRSEPLAKKTPKTIAAEPLRLGGLDIYDPFVGLVPGSAAREIAFISERDPANYNGNSAWGPRHTGRLWWDTSASPYLEAQTDILALNDPDRLAREIAYRKAYWGKFAPGSAVRVWEWSRLPEPPAVDDSAPIVGNLQLPPYVPVPEYDAALGKIVTVYYCWVLNPTVLPTNVPGRTLSAQQVAQILADPSGEGIAWVAPVMPNGMLVANLGPYLDNVDSVLQVELAQNDYDGIVHHEWKLARAGDDRLQPPADLLLAMNHSLSGLDDFGNAVPDPSLPVRDRMGFSIRPRRSLVAIDRAGMMDARASFVGIVNTIFARTNLITQRPSIVSDLTLSTPTYPDLIWSQATGATGLVPPPQNSYDFVATSIAERDAILTSHAYRVACGFLSPAVGFAPQYCVRYRSPRILLTNYEADRPSWSIWEVPSKLFGTDAVAQHPVTTLVVSKAFDLTFETHAACVAATTAGTVTEGQRCLIQSDERYQGFWTIFYYAPSSFEADADGLIFESAQTYRVSDFFKLVDWYAEGYDALNPPLMTYPSIARRNAVEGPRPVNTFVKISDDTTGHWIWTFFDGSAWSTVARQDGTVAISAALADPSRTPYAGRAQDLASIATRDGSLELRQIETALRESVLTKMQVNEVFFSLLHFVHTRQDQVDWAFKTSFLSIVGFNEKLLPTPVATYDTTENLINYIEEVKPYRVKTRDFTRMLTPPIEAINVRMPDFDKPVYFDTTLQEYRRLDPASPADMRIMAQTAPWSAWYGAYGNTGLDPTALGFNPVRRIRTTLRFDRINADLKTPQDSCTAWDTVPFDVLAYDADGQHGDDQYSALARLIAWYEPGVGSVARTETDELLGMGFGGAITDGGTFSTPGDDVTFDGGTPGTTPPLTLNPEIPGQAYGLRDPLHEANRPPELVVTLINEGLTITTHTQWAPGGPPQAVVTASTRGSRRSRITIPYPIAAACDDAILVYQDGLRAVQDLDYVIDHGARTVTFTLPAIKPRTILVHVFGVAGTGAVRSQAFYAGDGTRAVFPMDGLVGAGVVEAVVDGAVLAAQAISHDAATVTFGLPPANGASCMLTAYAPGSTPTRPVHEVFAYNAQQTWELNSGFRTVPACAGAIVEVDGRRLNPPNTRYGSFTVDNRIVSLGRTVRNLANLTVYLDGVPFVGTIAHVRRPGATTAGITARLAVVGRDLVAVDPTLQAARVVTVVREGHDFDIAPDGNRHVLTIIKPLGLSDWGTASYGNFAVGEGYTVSNDLRIEVTTFVGDAGIETHAFPGSTGGAYAVPSVAPADQVSVWLNGLRLVEGQSFTAFRGYVSADSAPIDSDGGFDTGPALIVTIPGGQKHADRVLVTAYARRAAQAPQTWRMNSAVPGPAIPGQRALTSTAGNPPAPRVATSTLGPRMTYLMQNSYEVFHLTPDATAVLATDVMPGDETITVMVNPKGFDLRAIDATPLTLPDLEAGVPGVIQIGPERIEYFSLQQTGNTLALSELRRGSRLSPRGIPHATSALLPGNGVSTAIVLEGADIAQPIEVGVRSADGQNRPLRLLSGYTLSAVPGGVSVALLVAPNAGETAYAVQDTAVLHRAGAPVFDISPGRKSVDSGPFRRREILDVVDQEPDPTIYRA